LTHFPFGADRLYVSKVDPDRHRPSAFARSLLSELDKPFAIEFRDAQAPQLKLEEV